MDGFQQCAHCQHSGTCKSGPKEGCCQVCFEYWKQRYPNIKDGEQGGPTRCSTCWGRGIVEPPGAVKWDYKTPAYLGAALAACSFALLFTLVCKHDTEGFAKALVFVGTLLGSITGYYFGGQKRVPAKSGDDPKIEEPASESGKTE